MRLLLAASAALVLAGCVGAPPASAPSAALTPGTGVAAIPSGVCQPAAAPASAAPEAPAPAAAPVLPAAPPMTEPAAIAPRAPAFRSVSFSGLPPGGYATHLHSVCSGSQAFHLAYLQSLVVGSGRTGALSLPAADFGRGWCVIVYTDASARQVLAVQMI